MEKKQKQTKQRRKKWILEIVISVLIYASPYVIIPEWHTWVVENPLTMLLCIVQAVVLVSVLMLGAYLLLKWVRAEKKEEDKV